MHVYFLTKERTIIEKNISVDTRWIAFNQSIYRIDNSAVGMSKDNDTLKSNAEIIYEEGNPFPLFTSEADKDDKKLGNILDDALMKNILDQTSRRSGFSYKDITGFFSNLSLQKLIPFIAIPVAIYVIYVIASTLLTGGKLIP